MINPIDVNGTNFTVTMYNDMIADVKNMFAYVGSQVISGLELSLSSPNALSFVISAGTFMAEQLVVISSSITTGLTANSTNYIWIDSSQTVYLTTTPTITGNKVCLGVVKTNATVVTYIGYDYRMQSMAIPRDQLRSITVTNGTYTLSPTQFNSPSIDFKGTLSANTTIVLPDWPGFQWTIVNGCTLGAYTLSLRTTLGGTPITLGAGVYLVRPIDGEFTQVAQITATVPTLAIV